MAIFSPIFDLAIPDYSTIVIKLLAIISASLAGIQTLFNFQREAELHLSAGTEYAKIYHQAKIFIAKYEDNLETNNFFTDFKKLQEEYLKANSDYKSCIPSDRDYNKAKESLNKRDRDCLKH